MSSWRDCHWVIGLLGEFWSQNTEHSLQSPKSLVKVYRWYLCGYENIPQNEFLNHIKAIDPNITFSEEETRQDGSIPFLDTLMMPKQDGALETQVYRGPPTLTFVFNGTTTIPCHQNIVYLTSSSIEQKLCAPNNSCYTKNKHIWERFYRNASTLNGLYSEESSGTSTGLVLGTTPLITTAIWAKVHLVIRRTRSPI